MSSKIIFVTGANRGIGFAIVQALATRFPSHTYLLGVRSLPSGHEAIQSLKALGLTSTAFEAIQIDITSDPSIASAVFLIKEKHTRIDILIPNAAIAERVKPGDQDFRASCNRTLDCNVTSFLVLASSFLPLLHASCTPQVIAISSARGSVHHLTTSQVPPTASIPYNISKTALNVAMLEMAKLESGVLWQAASPGHCKTAFNGWMGKKDPLDGARVVVELVADREQGDEGRLGMGFWEFEQGSLRSVEW